MPKERSEGVLPKGLDLDRLKRTRTSFMAEQLYRLEMEFQALPVRGGRGALSWPRQPGLSQGQVNGPRASLLHRHPGSPGGALGCEAHGLLPGNPAWSSDIYEERFKSYW